MSEVLEKLNQHKQAQEFASDYIKDRPPGSAKDCLHWEAGIDHQGVAHIYFNRQAASNTLASDIILELQNLLRLIKTENPSVVVLRSAKHDHFCYGADINEFIELNDKNLVKQHLNTGYEVLEQLQQFDCPTVALVNGHCLGGGLEMALACDVIIATPDASLGLPEVKLGLLPGLGGIFQLTHRVDPIKAMRTILSGKILDAGAALKMGLIDEVVDKRHWNNLLTRENIERLADRRSDIRSRILSTSVARNLEAQQMRAQSEKKAPSEHYPAPTEIISLWEKYGDDAEQMREASLDAFARLLDDEATQNLIRLFDLRKQMKAQRNKESSVSIEHLHVIGCGTMGADIAGLAAMQGMKVSLFDQDQVAMANSIESIARACKQKGLQGTAYQAVMDRVIPDFNQDCLRGADIVLEAVPEDPDIKRAVYSEIQGQLKTGAVIATNTSSIMLQQLRSELEMPSYFIGLHFFNPVYKMPLVELVRDEETGQKAIDTGLEFIHRLGKLPAVVQSAPGFLVNRVLMPYLAEAMIMLDEGVKAETIDSTVEKFGMPVGPLELADQVGLDVCLHVAKSLQAQGVMQDFELPRWLSDKVENGELGSKTGQGIYQWKKGEADKGRADAKIEMDFQDRLILPMLDACMACYREQVIDDEGVLDGAMVFGAGFAPFRGGPLRYSKKRGFRAIAFSMDELAKTHGKRFSPDPAWQEYAQTG